jgi:hypothetical protein
VCFRLALDAVERSEPCPFRRARGRGRASGSRRSSIADNHILKQSPAKVLARPQVSAAPSLQEHCGQCDLRRPRATSVHCVVGPRTPTRRPHQSCIAQDLQVLRDRRLSQIEVRHDVAHADRLGLRRDDREDREARGIAERPRTRDDASLRVPAASGAAARGRPRAQGANCDDNIGRWLYVAAAPRACKHPSVMVRPDRQLHRCRRSVFINSRRFSSLARGRPRRTVRRFEPWTT